MLWCPTRDPWLSPLQCLPVCPTERTCNSPSVFLSQLCAGQNPRAAVPPGASLGRWRVGTGRNPCLSPRGLTALAQCPQQVPASWAHSELTAWNTLCLGFLHVPLSLAHFPTSTSWNRFPKKLLALKSLALGLFLGTLSNTGHQ